MNRIASYFGNTVLAAILLVLLVIVGLDVITAIIDESGSIEGNYTFYEVLVYVFFSLPSRVYEYIPFAALIGCLTGLGSLATSSELVIVRSAGMSVGRIAWIVMKPALLVILLGLVIGEYVAPQTEQIAQSRRALAESGTGGFTSRRGLWNREGDYFMHFNAVQPNGILHGVTLMKFNEQRELQSLLFAVRASYLGQYWLLEEVEETRLEADRTRLIKEQTRRWNSSLTPDLLNVVIVQPEDLSLEGLDSYAHYLRAQGLDAGDYELAFWGKALQPLEVVGLVLVAISFVFGPLRDSTMGFKIFTGVVVGICFRTAQDLLGPASLVYGFSPLYATFLPIGICLLLGTVMLTRAR